MVMMYDEQLKRFGVEELGLRKKRGCNIVLTYCQANKINEISQRCLTLALTNMNVVCLSLWVSYGN